MAVECECYFASNFGATPPAQATAKAKVNSFEVKDYHDKDTDPCQSPGSFPENLIPYPRPASTVELRNGILYSGCQCLKRDGLQQDCPRTGCQGRAPCMVFPVPICHPSGNAPPQEEPPKPRRPPVVARRNPMLEKTSHPALPRARTPPQGHGRYVKLGQQNYKEDPPVSPKRPPCKEHRKPRT